MSFSDDKGASSSNRPASNQQSKIFGLNSSIAVTLLLTSPIIFSLAAYPDSFNLSWNQGRGGFLFAMAFIAAELLGLRYAIKHSRFYIVMALAGAAIGYFIALPLGLGDLIKNSHSEFHVLLVDSWTWMWDFIVMALFVGISLAVLFGKKWYKVAPAGPIYLGGSAVILSLDAFFPYDSLGPLQFIVPIYLQIDQAIIKFLALFMNLGSSTPATANGNILVLNGLHGPFALQVFWPSAGVHSMIIYSLVMLAFLLKMEMPLRRKLGFFAIGVIGTASVNVIRITLLSLYAILVTTDVNQWQAFHSVAGEIMFLPWLGIYLAIVMRLESKRIRKLRAHAASISSPSAGPDSSTKGP